MVKVEFNMDKGTLTFIILLISVLIFTTIAIISLKTQQNHMEESFSLDEICENPQDVYQRCILKEYVLLDEHAECMSFITKTKMICNNFDVEIIND